MWKQKIIAIWSKCFLKISKSWQPDFEELSPYISPDILYFFTVDKSSSYCISWNTTYSELLALNLGHLETDINDVQFYYFDIPIIVGHIKFNHAKILWNSTSLASPIQHYIVDIRDGIRHTDTYSRLLGILSKYETYAQKITDNTIMDEGSFNLSVKDIFYALNYSIPDKCTRLDIYNKRDYAYPILLDSNYQHQGTVSKIHYMSYGLKIEQYHHYYDYCIKPVPSFVTALLKYDEDNIIWIDSVNEVIGFKGDNFCLILPNKIESIQIDNLHPAKGWGGCWMQIKIEGFKSSIRIYQVIDVNQLNKYADIFSEFFAVDVVINDRGYDC